ncbi:hypothetical protein Sxan_50050 [Streptomyces xanthophaeus]|uniref:Uncharacterized protein n=1 Tax=Streptomyces xanthophaeus TaxID=67385 RepID=A0A919H3R6_9ACTN|nr:hypothetical protein Sxan_50050 [Streptomyces xanthophaeus]
MAGGQRQQVGGGADGRTGRQQALEGGKDHAQHEGEHGVFGHGQLRWALGGRGGSVSAAPVGRGDACSSQIQHRPPAANKSQ